ATGNNHNIDLKFGQAGTGGTLDLSAATQLSVGGGTSAITMTGGAGSDTIKALNIANTWSIAGANNNGDLNGAAFSSVENLTGGTNTDVFKFSDTFGVTGVIDGGGGLTNTLNWNSYTTGRNVVLTGLGGTVGFDGTEVNGSIGVGGFKNITAI